MCVTIIQYTVLQATMDRGKIVVAVILLIGIVPMILLLITNIAWTTKVNNARLAGSSVLWTGPQYLAVVSYFIGMLLGILDICMGDSMSSGRMICSIPSAVFSIIFLLTAGGTAFTSMVLLNIFVSSPKSPSDLVAIFVVESIGALGMIICYLIFMGYWVFKLSRNRTDDFESRRLEEQIKDNVDE